ncbi:hypothetical protein EVAR_72201_1 [Eumeta japonica]|uniref:Uncharacterized protein n=1 Tax=Eumeta variegata TaxID=151549 RepID=A0A4C1SMB3_EUMVA|nr:hypothetical protein EVAR_72201_1 [Eumeta japonica]
MRIRMSVAARSTRLGVAQRDRTPAHQDHHVSRECEFEYHRKTSGISRRGRADAHGGQRRPSCVRVCCRTRAPRPGPACIFCDYPQFIEISDIHTTAPKLMSPHSNSLKCWRLGTRPPQTCRVHWYGRPGAYRTLKCPTPRAYHAADGGRLPDIVGTITLGEPMLQSPRRSEEHRRGPEREEEDTGSLTRAWLSRAPNARPRQPPLATRCRPTAAEHMRNDARARGWPGVSTGLKIEERRG